jgi:hypothetical protein
MATPIVGLVLSVAVVDGSQQAAGGQVSHTYGTAGTSGETLTVDDGGGGVAGWRGGPQHGHDQGGLTAIPFDGAAAGPEMASPHAEHAPVASPVRSFGRRCRCRGQCWTGAAGPLNGRLASGARRCRLPR